MFSHRIVVCFLFILGGFRKRRGQHFHCRRVRVDGGFRFILADCLTLRWVPGALLLYPTRSPPIRLSWHAQDTYWPVTRTWPLKHRLEIRSHCKRRVPNNRRRSVSNKGRMVTSEPGDRTISNLYSSYTAGRGTTDPERNGRLDIRNATSQGHYEGRVPFLRFAGLNFTGRSYNRLSQADTHANHLGSAAGRIGWGTIPCALLENGIQYLYSKLAGERYNSSLERARCFPRAGTRHSSWEIVPDQWAQGDPAISAISVDIDPAIVQNWAINPTTNQGVLLVNPGNWGWLQVTGYSSRSTSLDLRPTC